MCVYYRLLSRAAAAGGRTPHTGKCGGRSCCRGGNAGGAKEGAKTALGKNKKNRDNKQQDKKQKKISASEIACVDAHQRRRLRGGPSSSSSFVVFPPARARLRGFPSLGIDDPHASA